MASFILCIGAPDAIFPYSTAPPRRESLCEWLSKDRRLVQRTLTCRIESGPLLTVLPVAPGALEASLYFNGALWLERTALLSISQRMLTFDHGLIVSFQDSRVPHSFILADPSDDQWTALKACVV
jgi:hypothetical protein